MPPVPRHIPAIHRRDTSIQSRNRTPRPTTVSTPASVASNSSWTFSAEELRKFRNITAKLHPDVRLQTHKLGIWPVICPKKGRRKQKSCKPPPFKYNVSDHTTCAVVGNGGILLESHCGAEIDSKDYVIRMNLPAIRGFERDVGRRTNLTVLNVSTPNRIRNSSLLENRTEDVYESRLRDINGTFLIASAREHAALETAMQQYQNQFSFVLLTSRRSFKVSRHIHRAAPGVHSAPEGGTPGLPSTGLAAVLTATALCDHLFLYGFFPFQQDENKRPLPYHYYPGDSIEPIIQAENHYMDKEYQFTNGGS
ncbi:alpha-2,8-sialyltransferase 8B-like [Branchiostoma lanceolatum]|uniref:alpha-2,8-sialyltransferase 8B-like n=1 Tax=Branchiostoma lanceolatum TaxID=7740 RepID=UPI0034532CD9